MFREQLARDAARIQSQFDLVLGGLDDLDVTRAMAYTTQGGKRLRGFLVLESAPTVTASAVPRRWSAAELVRSIPPSTVV